MLAKLYMEEGFHGTAPSGNPLTQQERGGEIYTRTQGTWEAGHTTGLCENTEVKMS